MPLSLVVAAVFGLLVPGAAPALAEPVRDSQWHLAFLKIPEVHAISQGEGVTVAVIDTGVDASHPDLAGSVLPGTDLSNLGAPDGRQDLDGHGTAMAGLIVAHGSALGIAPSARILPIRDSASRVNESEIGPAIDWAVAHGAGVLSLALSVPDSAALSAAVQRALKADVVIVAAVGNRPDDLGVGYPAAYEGVIAAAGVDRDGKHADVSVVGSSVVLAAPAVDVLSTTTGGTHAIGEGTSGATAIIAGAAALVRSTYPDLSAREVYHRLTATADDRGPPGRDIEYGYGIVNPLKALTAELAPSAGPDGPRQPPRSGFPTRTVLIGLASALLLAAAVAGVVAITRRRSRAA